MSELPCDDHPFESNPSEVDFRTHFRNAAAVAAAVASTVEDEDVAELEEEEVAPTFSLCCPHSLIHHRSWEVSLDIDR
tara:strand:- start:231 stop:464 length:234 start_codon:yes stop_codon:yes gene_type:complete